MIVMRNCLRCFTRQSACICRAFGNKVENLRQQKERRESRITRPAENNSTSNTGQDYKNRIKMTGSPLLQLHLTSSQIAPILPQILLHLPSLADRFRLHSFAGPLRRALNDRIALADIRRVSNRLTGDLIAGSSPDNVQVFATLIGHDLYQTQTIAFTKSADSTDGKFKIIVRLATGSGSRNSTSTRTYSTFDSVDAMKTALQSLGDYLTRRLRVETINIVAAPSKSDQPDLVFDENRRFPRLRHLRIAARDLEADEFHRLMDRCGQWVVSLTMKCIPDTKKPFKLGRLTRLRLNDERVDQGRLEKFMRNMKIENPHELNTIQVFTGAPGSEEVVDLVLSARGSLR